MKQERKIIAYKHYFIDFMKSIGVAEDTEDTRE